MARAEHQAELLRLAERIADLDPIDWDSEPTTVASPSRQLRVVERIGLVHRKALAEDLPFESWGTLDLERPIARGGFGEVFLARDRSLGHMVALKLLDADDEAAATDFVNEARRLARVRHANVVRVYGVDRHAGRTGLWMEWIDGQSLSQLVDERGPLGAREAALVGIELCRALAAVHSAGLVHRDVKLSNVMRARGGRIVLMDFGSSTRRDAELAPRGLSGTRAYLAPEAFRGKDSGERMDLYALGVTLYRLASGAYPGEPVSETPGSAERTPVPLRDRNPDLPPGFVRVVEQAMDADPRRRFASAGEMERALIEVLGAATPEAARPTRRRWIPWAAAAALVLSVLAAVALSRVGSFDAEATFFRVAKSGNGERLTEGTRVQPGDQLFLEVTVEQRSWLYVIDSDAAGSGNLLFPVEGLPLANPLPPGTHQLPGPGGAWEVTSAGGEERLLVVASSQPIEPVEREIAKLPPVRPGEPPALADGQVVEKLRGIGAVTFEPQPETSSGSVPDEVRRGVVLHAGSGRGVKVWELVLRNPRGDGSD